MRTRRGLKWVAVLAFVGILALGLATLSLAQDQNFGKKLGTQGSQESGDLTKNKAQAKAPESGSSSFGKKLGTQGSQESGDLSKNKVPVKQPAQDKPGSFGKKLGTQGSQESGDLSKSGLERGK
jgi:hypothetical protein